MFARMSEPGAPQEGNEPNGGISDPGPSAWTGGTEGGAAGPTAPGPAASGDLPHGSSGADATGEAAATPIALIVNRKSGTNARDSDAIRRAMDVFGDDTAEIHHWDPKDDPAKVVRRAIEGGARTVVAAGGDGTAMAVASAMLGTGVTMGVLPLGTFNFFSRGLGLPEDPEAAARGILSGRRREIRVGTVNGQVFLNNASLGIYPAILRERESVYARWGRRRIMAHWSVLRTFLRFQRPMRMRITVDGETRDLRSPLLFAARSAYQLQHFGLEGAEAIRDDNFAILLGRGQTRWDLFLLAWRLATRRMREGRDYEMIRTKAIQVETGKRRALVAFDGEKRRDRSPFDFRLSDEVLTVVAPEADDAADDTAGGAEGGNGGAMRPGTGGTGP